MDALFNFRATCYRKLLTCYHEAPVEHEAQQLHLAQCQQMAAECYASTLQALTEKNHSAYTSTDNSCTKTLQHPHPPSSPTRARSA